MSKKSMPGESLTLSTLGTTRPQGEAGIDMTSFTGAARTKLFLVTIELEDESARAELDLDTPSVALDTIVKAKAPYLGVEGNAIHVVAVADSATGDGATIEEDLSTMTVTIHFEDGVSTVALVEAAITASATLIEVKTAGTAATVLTSADAFASTALAGGADAATTEDFYLWGRDDTTKRWGRHNDVYGRCILGKALTAANSGVHHLFMNDIGNYDRVTVVRSAGTGVANLRVTEINSMGVGN